MRLLVAYRASRYIAALGDRLVTNVRVLVARFGVERGADLFLHKDLPLSEVPASPSDSRPLSQSRLGLYNRPMRSVVVAAMALGVCCSEPQERSGAEDEKLGALPYVSWGRIEEGDASKHGVTVHDPERAYPGINLYNSLPRTSATLTDMDGRTLHTWSADTGSEWGHVEILAGGDLLVFSEGPHRLIRLDWDSTVLWKRALWAHHDADIGEDGDLYVLEAYRKEISHRSLRIPIQSDYLTVLSPGGKVLKVISFLDVLRDKIDLDHLADFVESGGARREPVDLVHVNTLSIIRDTRGRYFEKGNVLFAARSLDLIGVLDVEAERLVWSWGKGQLDGPHQPTLLDDGHILIFDNGAHRSYSRIVELDPVTERIVWEYKADPPEAFYTKTMGGIEALPNGNVLITESERGRAFEITRDGDIVWEFHNPDIDESKRQRAAIFRMTRIDPALLAGRLPRAHH